MQSGSAGGHPAGGKLRPGCGLALDSGRSGQRRWRPSSGTGRTSSRMMIASTRPGATDPSACRGTEEALWRGAPSQRMGSSSAGRQAGPVGLLGFPRGSEGRRLTWVREQSRRPQVASLPRSAMCMDAKLHPARQTGEGAGPRRTDGDRDSLPGRLLDGRFAAMMKDN